jgi:hypothetical protein
MENKQTAVEWVFEYLWKNHHLAFSDNIFDQAKQMEKDQIKQAWIDGMRSVSIAPFEDEFYKYEAELYYDKMREIG